MKIITRTVASTFLVLGAVLCILISKSEAAEWTVAKVSGAVWVGSAGVQTVSLGSGSRLDGGDQIKTGANGRVMLVRGEETILVSPNSAISLPKSPSAGLKTTILQQAGSILLSVEKRNVQHFEVQTPFLAAVVKGTRFAVTVSPSGANVDVTDGKVEVADFRSGQIAFVLPGQSALVRPDGRPGLALSGSGKFEAIRQGRPRKPSIEALNVPAAGFTGPKDKSVGQSARSSAGDSNGKANRHLQKANGRVRINAPIGEVRINFSKVTDKLARGHDDRSSRKSGKHENTTRVSTIWEDDESSSGPGDGTGHGLGLGLGGGNGGGNSGGNGGGLALGLGGGNGGGLALGLGGGNGGGLALGLGGGLGLGLGGGHGHGHGHGHGGD